MAVALASFGLASGCSDREGEADVGVGPDEGDDRPDGGDAGTNDGDPGHGDGAPDLGSPVEVPLGVPTTFRLDLPRGARTFDVFVSSQGLQAKPPLLVVFHGGNRSRADVLSDVTGLGGFRDVAESERVLLIAPNGSNADGEGDAPQANWNDCRQSVAAATNNADDGALFDALVAWAARHFDIDEQRVFIAGPSNGGLMTYRLALERGARIAGAAAFIANMTAEPEQCVFSDARVPMLIMNGTSDRLMAFEGGALTQGSGGNVMSSDATAAFWAERNGTLLAQAAVDYPDINLRDGSTASRVDYLEEAGGIGVRYVVVTGGGHTIPSVRYRTPGALLLGGQNRDIEGAAEAWAFFSQVAP